MRRDCRQGDLLPHPDGPGALGDGAWTVASTESSRYYLATIGPESNRHLMIVALSSGRTPADERLRFEKAVAPILDSLDVSRVTFN